MAVLHVTGALDDNVGMRLEQADKLLSDRHAFAAQHPAFALIEHAGDQRQIMI